MNFPSLEELAAEFYSFLTADAYCCLIKFRAKIAQETVLRATKRNPVFKSKTANVCRVERDSSIQLNIGSREAFFRGKEKIN